MNDIVPLYENQLKYEINFNYKISAQIFLIVK